jgi:hypothetical protein
MAGIAPGACQQMFITTNCCAERWGLARGMRAAGVAFDPRHRQQLDIDSVQQTALAQHLQRVEAALPIHTRMRHYFWAVRPECLQPGWYGMPDYLSEVRELRCRRGLTELRTGLHWGAEETGRRTVPFTARERRVCPHCSGGVEDTHHIVFACPLYGPERARWPELFTGRPPDCMLSFSSQLPPPPSSLRPAAAAAGRPMGRLPNCPITSC